MRAFRSGRAVLSLCLLLAVLAGGAGRILGACGPFTDVAADSFCPFVLEIFYLGITTGTTPTTYDPVGNVTRLQMAAFLSRSVDGVLKRGSRRAALDQHWTTQSEALGLTTVGTGPQLVKCDGLDVWVANIGPGTLSRVRAADGRLLETWTGMTTPRGVVAAMGRIFVSGFSTPGRLYRIDPSEAAGAATAVATDLGNAAFGIAFDGLRVWTANEGAPGSVSIVTPGASIPWTVTTVAAGFTTLAGALYDGANIWVTDHAEESPGFLRKLSSSGAILQTVTVGIDPEFPAFDGANIWVPNLSSASVSVVRASNGAVLATLTASGLTQPSAAAFDGQRILVTSLSNSTVCLWKAADLTAIGAFSTGTSTFPYGAASDGVNFWIALNGAARLARF